MTFDEWVNQYTDEDSVELARRVIREAPELVVAVVIEAIGRLRTHAQREQSASMLREFGQRVSGQSARAAFLPAGPDTAITGPVKSEDSGASGMAGLLAQMRGIDRTATFSLDGKMIAWGAATAKQHEAMAGVLRLSIRIANAAIEKHEAVARLLRQTGALCLDKMKLHTA